MYVVREARQNDFNNNPFENLGSSKSDFFIARPSVSALSCSCYEIIIVLQDFEILLRN